MNVVRSLPLFPKIFLTSSIAGIFGVGLTLIDRNAAFRSAFDGAAEPVPANMPGLFVYLAVLVVLGVAALLALTLTRSAQKIQSDVADLGHNRLDTSGSTGRTDVFGRIGSELARLQKVLQEKNVHSHAREEFYDAIHASQCVISLKPDGSIEHVNGNCLKALNWPEKEVLGSALSAKLDQEFATSEAYSAIWNKVQAGKPASGALVFALSGDRKLSLQAGFSPLSDADGKFHQTVLVGSVIQADTAGAMKQTPSSAATEVVNEVSAALVAISKGDLTTRMKLKPDCALDFVRGNFNAVATKLDDAMASVVTSSTSIVRESEQLASASNDLSHRTENQAAALEQTAASLEQLTASVKAAAEGAGKANADAAKTRRNAEESGRIVNTAIDAMGEIEKSSDHISQIIGVIDDIAFQTNLLALNAGVEAARAGDAGRGFAVVASEVRALAQRSSNAAKEIKALITTSSEQVGRGVELVQETGKALKIIVESVNGVTVLVEDIASSAKEQSVGLTEINSAVNQLDQVTQQNAAMVEESTAASQSLKSDAADLARLVAEFKTKFVQPKAVTPKTAAPIKPVSKPAATAEKPAVPKAPARTATPPVAKPVATPPPVRRPVQSAGSAALAIEARNPVDDWEDF